jgi:hypothetical protein
MGGKTIPPYIIFIAVLTTNAIKAIVTTKEAIEEAKRNARE